MYLSQSQRTIELYTELTTMICDFIGVSRIAQSTEFDYNNTKLNIAVRLRVKKKVQNLNAMWYKEFAKNFATQGDFGHESP